MAPSWSLAAASRRTLLRLAPAALLYALGSRRALAEPVRSAVLPGLLAMEELARQLRRGQLRPTAWQDEMSALVAGLPVTAAVRALDLDRLAAALDLPDDRPLVRELLFPELDQALRDAGLRPKLFVLGPGRAIVPHGHHAMVSMHWVLHGALHGRHYDRLEQTRTHVRMRPTLDRVLRPGAATSVSDDRDNIHWFVAVEGPAFALDVVVSHLRPDGPHGRFYVDPRGAQVLGGGELRAPIVSAAEARRRYGRG
jgi:PCO_ADO